MPATVTVPAGYLVGINELILKVIWKGKGMRTEKHFEKGVGRLTLPGFQTYSKAAIIKTHGARDTLNHQNRRESRDRPTPVSQLLFNKGVEAIQQRKKSLLNKRCWSDWTFIH